jgi:hypothetical protein
MDSVENHSFKALKIMECRVIQGISTVLKGILERSFGAQNVKTLF